MAYERFQFVKGTNGGVAIYHPYWKKYLKCDGKKIKTSNDKYDFTVTQKHGDKDRIVSMWRWYIYRGK